MRTKVCTQCKEDKPIDQFYRHEITTSSMCQKCKSEYYKKRSAKQKKLLKPY